MIFRDPILLAVCRGVSLSIFFRSGCAPLLRSRSTALGPIENSIMQRSVAATVLSVDLRALLQKQFYDRFISSLACNM